MKRIAIEYVDIRRYDAVYIDWTLGNFCNFSCSYCPTYLHNNSFPMADIDITKKFTTKLLEHYSNNLGKRYFVFNLMGGEPTLWKHFESFATWLKEYSHKIGVYSQIEILTNGSRTLRWWNEYIKFIDIVKITHHTEFANPEHSAEVADCAVENNVHSIVQVTMIPKLWEVCLDHLKRISNSKYKFQIDTKPLRVDFGSILYPYTEDQLKIFETSYRSNEVDLQTNTIGMQSLSIFDNGKNQINRYQDLITSKENTWVDWDCWAGIDIISIKPDGTITLGGACGMNKTDFVGKNITDSYIDFPIIPVKCKQEWCSCGPDMETRKRYVGR